MQKYHLGLVSVSFRSHTPEEILKAMKHTGLQCIEWGSDVHAPCDDLSRLENLAKLQAEYGITCCSYGTYFRLGTTPIAELPQYIRAAKILGTDILRLWCGNKNSEDYTPAEKAQLFQECKNAAVLAEQAGVTLCMECHNNTYTNTKEGAYELMQAVNSPAFRMYWQPNQFRTFAENISYATMLAPYSLHLHVFNWQGNEKYPLHLAQEVWKAYLNCFNSEKTLLLEFMPDDKIETLEQEATTLKEITQ